MSNGTSLFAITPRAQPPKPGENKKQGATSVPPPSHPFSTPANSSLSNPSLSKYIQPSAMAGAPPVTASSGYTSSSTPPVSSTSAEVKERTPSWKLSNLWGGGGGGGGGSAAGGSSNPGGIRSPSLGITNSASTETSSISDQKEKDKKERESSFFGISRTIGSDRFMRCSGFWGLLIVPVILWMCFSGEWFSTLMNWFTNTQAYSSWYSGTTPSSGQSSSTWNGGNLVNDGGNGNYYQGSPWAGMQGQDQNPGINYLNPTDTAAPGYSPSSGWGGPSTLWNGGNNAPTGGQMFSQQLSNNWNSYQGGAGGGVWKNRDVECQGSRNVWDEQLQECICPLQICGPGCNQDADTCECVCTHQRYEEPPIPFADLPVDDFESEKNFFRLAPVPHRPRPIMVSSSSSYLVTLFIKGVIIPITTIILFILVCRCCRSYRTSNHRFRDRQRRSRSRSR